LFHPKTTLFWLTSPIFAYGQNLIIFAMGKDFVKRISVWEKISDFMMDISKYVLTAVIITSAFEELSGVGWAMYVVGVAGTAIFFAASLLIMYKSNKKR
jgi:hypothetical protein